MSRVWALLPARFPGFYLIPPGPLLPVKNQARAARAAPPYIPSLPQSLRRFPPSALPAAPDQQSLLPGPGSPTHPSTRGQTRFDAYVYALYMHGGRPPSQGLESIVDLLLSWWAERAREAAQLLSAAVSATCYGGRAAGGRRAERGERAALEAGGGGAAEAEAEAGRGGVGEDWQREEAGAAQRQRIPAWGGAMGAPPRRADAEGAREEGAASASPSSHPGWGGVPGGGGSGGPSSGRSHQQEPWAGGWESSAFPAAAGAAAAHNSGGTSAAAAGGVVVLVVGGTTTTAGYGQQLGGGAAAGANPAAAAGS